MKIVAVTRLLNEDDIVEAFIRHHAPMVDHHIVLDNGSIDRSIEILQALAVEGVSLSVLQGRSVTFREADSNTFLYHHACGAFGADWVVFLDADEFIDARESDNLLRARLAAVPTALHAANLELAQYLDTAEADAGDLLVPRRLHRRLPELSGVLKVAVRRVADWRDIVVNPGNHDAALRGDTLVAHRDPALILAHYPLRSPWQQLTKSVMGWLKVVAGGQGAIDTGWSFHYRPVAETLARAPAELLLGEGFMRHRHADAPLVSDPIRYAGGALRHTVADDPRMKAVRALYAYAEELARQHGRLIDENALVRQQVQTWAAALKILI